MIDKVIKLPNQLEYYIIDQIIKDKKIYLFAIQVDNLNDVVTDNCIVLEVNFDGENLNVNNISDLKLQEEINNIFISRMNKMMEEN